MFPDIQTWMNVLPVGRWTCFYAPDGELLLKFRLKDYAVINRAPTMSLETEGGRQMETGMGALQVIPELAIRFYVPIELHQVPAIGLSPKLVFTMPRGCRVEEFKAEEYVSPEAKMYEKARHHTTIKLKG